MSVPTLFTTGTADGTMVQYNNYLYIVNGGAIYQYDLSGTKTTWFTFTSSIYQEGFTICGNAMYFLMPDNKIGKLIINTSNGVNTPGAINYAWYTLDTTSRTGFYRRLFSDGNNLYARNGAADIYKIPVNQDGTPGTLFTFPIKMDSKEIFATNNSIIYYVDGTNSLITCDSSGNVINTALIRFSSPLISTSYSFGRIVSIKIINNYIYIGTGSAVYGGARYLTQFDLSGNLITGNFIPTADLDSLLQLDYLVNIPNTNDVYIKDSFAYKIYKISITPSETILPPLQFYSNMNLTFNNVSVMDCIVTTNSNNRVLSAYDSTDLTTNLIASTSDPIVSAMITKMGYTFVNHNEIYSQLILTKIPALNAVFKSVKYWMITSSVNSVDYFGERAGLLTYINTYTASSYFNVNSSIYTTPTRFNIGTYSFTVTRTSISFPTAPVVKTIDYSLGGNILYTQFVLSLRTNVLVDYFAVTSGAADNTKLHSVYSPKLDYNLSYPYSNSPSVYAGAGGVGILRMNLTSIPLIDTLYSYAAYFTMHSNDFINFHINVNYNGEQPSYNSIPFDVPNCSITYTLIAEPIVIRNKYTKIQINYSTIVNGNPVSGLVFEGYYRFLSNNNVVEGFYSSSDLSTNLIIPNTDSFVTGARTLLGKSSSNIASYTGIDTTSTHAGVFVKNLPFVNALFKSNPYVVLKPSGLVMFDNYGVVNSNVLATSYFTNKYVISNNNVYSNKNNSFFSFSNFTFNYTPLETAPTIAKILPIDYTFFNSIKQIKYNAKYNGAVLLDSYFVFYLDSSNNYHMCAQYPTTDNKNVLLFSDSSCDNFPNTGNFGNTLGTVNPDPTVSTIVAVSGNAATATVTTSTVSVTGTPTVTGSVTAVGTVARVNLNALNSNICFSEGSIVSTDQGDVEIQHIDITYHTIRNKKIIALTETQSVDDYLVKIKKNAFGNVPTQDTETTGNHMIFNGLSMVRAKTLINGTTIEKIPYRGLPLYNILLEHHDIMTVNGLACETLNPENPIATYYMLMAEHPENRVEMENMWRKRTQEIIHAIA